MRVEYKDDNVYEASKRRISKIFDEFDNIIVSVSGGKDSTVLFNLCYSEVKKRDREISLFFLDQEAEYEATIRQIGRQMRKDLVKPKWFQVPINLTNATSYDEYFFRAWEEGEEWIREKNPLAIKNLNEDYPERFYGFMEWFEEKQNPNTAILAGLRSKESLNRFRSVTKNSGYKGITWTTGTEGDSVYRMYPIYDWKFEDVWKYISDNNLPYNKIYDLMYADDGINKRQMRVSNLIHERSYHSLLKLRKYEPDTFSKLTNRLSGVHFASIYIKRNHAFDVDELPSAFNSWEEYRDFLIETTPTDKKERYIERFKKQENHKEVYKAQCKQILINDWENNVSVNRKGIDDKKECIWRERLSLDKGEQDGL